MTRSDDTPSSIMSGLSTLAVPFAPTLRFNSRHCPVLRSPPPCRRPPRTTAAAPPVSTKRLKKIKISMGSSRTRIAIPSKSLLFWARWAWPSTHNPVASLKSKYNVLQKRREMAMPDRYHPAKHFPFFIFPREPPTKKCDRLNEPNSRPYRGPWSLSGVDDSAYRSGSAHISSCVTLASVWLL